MKRDLGYVKSQEIGKSRMITAHKKCIVVNIVQMIFGASNVMSTT